MHIAKNRVTLITTGLNRGGAETQVFHLAKGLRARGWKAEVVSLISGGNMADQFRGAEIPLHELCMKRGIPYRALSCVCAESSAPFVLTSFIATWFTQTYSFDSLAWCARCQY